MKKLRLTITIALFLCFVGTFTACLDITDTGTPSSAGETAKETASQSTVATDEIASGDGLIVDAHSFSLKGNTLFLSVPNEVESYSFLGQITVSEGATWTISTDLQGRDIVPSKTVPLEEGNNALFLLVMSNNDESLALYTVSIWREPKLFEMEDGTIIGVTDYFKQHITDVAIGNEVTAIGGGSFANCTNLKSITIGSTVVSIGGDAFYNCSNLTNVTIEEGVAEIGTGAFCGCIELRFVSLPNSLTSIGDAAFLNCKKLARISIPDSVTCVGFRVFEGCEILDYNTYDQAGYLGNEDNPYVLLVYCYESFSSSTIHPQTKVVAGAAFRECTHLQSIVIPNSVVSIGKNAFQGCVRLGSVTIGDSVTEINDLAFVGCACLSSIVVSNSVKRIGGSVFQDCSSLSVIKYLGTTEQWEGINKRDHWNFISYTEDAGLTVQCVDGDIPN